MIPVHVGLVDATGRIPGEYLAEVAGALNEQVQRDIAPAWGVRATVGVYASRQADPYLWQVRMVAEVKDALGYHTNLRSGQPISFVQYEDDWPAIASHEIAEMLADPYGRHTHQARLPLGVEDRYRDFGLRHPTSRVSYLVELADPCEATTYEVGGVELSDFLLPEWYRTSLAVNVPVSHAGGCVFPREVAPGGYVSFANPTTDEWYQVFADRNGGLSIESLGRFDMTYHDTLRAWTDERSREYRART
jgi:hypothetical protein